MVVTVGITGNAGVVAPVLQLYASAPEAVKVVPAPRQTESETAKTDRFGRAKTVIGT